MLFDYLADKHGFRQEYLDTQSRYAKFQYECGNYSAAAEYLYFFIVLVPATVRNAFNSLWGKLASEILKQNWDAAMEDLTGLNDTIDNNSVSSPLSLFSSGHGSFIGLCLFSSITPKGAITLLIFSFTSHSILMQFKRCVHIFFAV